MQPISESKGKIGDDCFEVIEELKQRIPSEMDFDVLDTKEAKEEEKKLARIYSSINRISHILLSVTTEIPKCKCEKSNKSCVNIALILSELETSDGFEFEKAGLTIYQSLKKDTQPSLQVMRDVPRTYIELIDEDSKKQLGSLLTVYSLIDIEIGYVQGLNFIMGSFLYHTKDEQLAFYLFAKLMRIHNLRELFLNGLPGVNKHCYIIEKCIEAYFPDVFSFFDKKGVVTVQYGCSWVMTLFNSVVPVDCGILVILEFVRRGWIYIYQLALCIIEEKRETILNKEFSTEIINNETKDKENPFSKFFKGLFKIEGKKKKYWKNLINAAKTKFYLNSKHIDEVLASYDYNTNKFKTQMDIKLLIKK